MLNWCKGNASKKQKQRRSQRDELQNSHGQCKLKVTARKMRSNKGSLELTVCKIIPIKKRDMVGRTMLSSPD